jgi:hypothetical protein
MTNLTFSQFHHMKNIYITVLGWFALPFIWCVNGRIKIKQFLLYQVCFFITLVFLPKQIAIILDVLDLALILVSITAFTLLAIHSIVQK